MLFYSLKEVYTKYLRGGEGGFYKFFKKIYSPGDQAAKYFMTQ